MRITKSVICPNCKDKYKPYGAFMLEKCQCPSCGYAFHILKGAGTIRILYSILVFVILILAYDILRPKTSVIIALFWILAMIILKGVTHITHLLLLIGWIFIQKLNRIIFKERKEP